MKTIDPYGRHARRWTLACSERGGGSDVGTARFDVLIGWTYARWTAVRLGWRSGIKYIGDSLWGFQSTDAAPLTGVT